MKDIVGLLCAVIVIIATADIIYRGTRQYLKKRKPTPAEPTELDDLVQQERSKQGVPLLAWVAVNAPVDVKTLTLILQYKDDKRLVMECGRPERIGVEL